MPQQLNDPRRTEALYAALRIAELNATEHIATATGVVQDAEKILSFLAPSSAYSPAS